MAEHLNEYFKSVFTMEDISILPVLETNFEGREPDSSIVGSYQMTLGVAVEFHRWKVKGHMPRLRVKWRHMWIGHELVAPLVDRSCTSGAAYGQVTN